MSDEYECDVCGARPETLFWLDEEQQNLCKPCLKVVNGNTKYDAFEFATAFDPQNDHHPTCRCKECDPDSYYEF